MTRLIKSHSLIEMEARFYAGELILALNSIHSQGFLHRDIKPDNILLMKDGHIRLTDFGVATSYSKQIDPELHQLTQSLKQLTIEELSIDPNYGTRNRRHTIIGSCDYIAPEIYRGQPPTIKSDLWSYGCIIYEMIYGFPPFGDETPQKTAKRILLWRNALMFPPGKKVSPAAIDLITKLLCEPDDRIRFDAIIQHSFFKGFDFANPSNNKPIFVPVVLHDRDVSNFDTFNEASRTQKNSNVLSDLMKSVFLGFTWKGRPETETLMQLRFLSDTSERTD
jgi:serine/threonine protein kinase